MPEIYIRADESTGIVTFIHKRPFDPVQGLGETRENLLKTGFFVDSIPNPVTAVGKKAVAYYDHEQKKVYYQYQSSPYPEKERLTLIEEAINSVVLSRVANNYSVAAMSLSNEEESGRDNIMLDGLAKYLAVQIDQKKLDYDMVIKSYPELKESIDAYLDDMQIIPTIKADENK